jgi:hypothetical protein
VHVADEAQVLPVSARLADGAAPFFNGLEDLELDARGADRGSFREAADQLVEKLLGADLQVEGVAAVLDANVEQVEGEHGDVAAAVVDVADDGDGGLARGGPLLGINQVGDFEIQGEVGFVVLGAASCLDEAMELGRRGRAHLPPAVSRGEPRRSRLHVDGVWWCPSAELPDAGCLLFGCGVGENGKWKVARSLLGEMSGCDGCL